MNPAKKPAENPATEPTTLWHADADPKIYQCALLVVNQAVKPTEAARRIFGPGLTKRELDSKRVNISKCVKRLRGSTGNQKQPMPVGAIWSPLDDKTRAWLSLNGVEICAGEANLTFPKDKGSAVLEPWFIDLDGYQLCACCWHVIPKIGKDGQVIPSGDVALAIPVVAGVQAGDGYRGKSVWSFLCFDCATGNKSRWPGRWSRFLKAALTHTAAMRCPLDNIPDDKDLWRKLWLDAMSPRRWAQSADREQVKGWHLRSTVHLNSSRKIVTSGDRIVAQQPVTLTVRGPHTNSTFPTVDVFESTPWDFWGREHELTPFGSYKVYANEMDAVESGYLKDEYGNLIESTGWWDDTVAGNDRLGLIADAASLEANSAGRRTSALDKTKSHDDDAPSHSGEKLPTRAVTHPIEDAFVAAYDAMVGEKKRIDELACFGEATDACYWPIRNCTRDEEALFPGRYPGFELQSPLPSLFEWCAELDTSASRFLSARQNKLNPLKPAKEPPLPKLGKDADGKPVTWNYEDHTDPQVREAGDIARRSTAAYKAGKITKEEAINRRKAVELVFGTSLSGADFEQKLAEVANYIRHADLLDDYEKSKVVKLSPRRTILTKYVDKLGLKGKEDQPHAPQVMEWRRVQHVDSYMKQYAVWMGASEGGGWYEHFPKIEKNADGKTVLEYHLRAAPKEERSGPRPAFQCERDAKGIPADYPVYSAQYPKRGLYQPGVRQLSCLEHFFFDCADLRPKEGFEWLKPEEKLPKFFEHPEFGVGQIVGNRETVVNVRLENHTPCARWTPYFERLLVHMTNRRTISKEYLEGLGYFGNYGLKGEVDSAALKIVETIEQDVEQFAKWEKNPPSKWPRVDPEVSPLCSGANRHAVDYDYVLVTPPHLVFMGCDGKEIHADVSRLFLPLHSAFRTAETPLGQCWREGERLPRLVSPGAELRNEKECLWIAIAVREKRMEGATEKWFARRDRMVQRNFEAGRYEPPQRKARLYFHVAMQFKDAVLADVFAKRSGIRAALPIPPRVLRVPPYPPIHSKLCIFEGKVRRETCVPYCDTADRQAHLLGKNEWNIGRADLSVFIPMQVSPERLALYVEFEGLGIPRYDSPAGRRQNEIFRELIRIGVPPATEQHCPNGVDDDLSRTAVRTRYRQCLECSRRVTCGGGPAVVESSFLTAFPDGFYASLSVGNGKIEFQRV